MAPLTPRALNRATLDRQLLLDRSSLSVPETIAHLTGLQAQAPFPPYTGLWSRLADFQPDDLARLLLDRSAVRTVLMRGTVHLVTAADCLALRPVLQPMLDRGLRNAFGKHLEGLDLDVVAKAGRELVEEKPLSTKELAARLGELWPDRNANALANVVRAKESLVQLPPRAVWGRSGQTVVTTAQSWLGAPLASDTAPDELVLRYFRAFGPATVVDVQRWSGLTRLREVVERLPLRTFRGSDGSSLFDVPDVELPDPDTPAPVRFLPEFDNLLVSYADGSRVMGPDDRAALMTANGTIRATVFVDGRAEAFWKLTKDKRSALLEIRPFRALSANVRNEVEAEGWALLSFTTDAGQTRDLRILAAGVGESG